MEIPCFLVYFTFLFNYSSATKDTKNLIVCCRELLPSLFLFLPIYYTDFCQTHSEVWKIEFPQATSTISSLSGPFSLPHLPAH